MSRVFDTATIRNLTAQLETQRLKTQEKVDRALGNTPPAPTPTSQVTTAASGQ